MADMDRASTHLTDATSDVSADLRSYGALLFY